MQKSQNAFTMVELIFVIVILGILAAVAVPKLNATRDDAYIVKSAQNIMLGAGEIASYATSKGITDTDLAVMSNGIKALEQSGDAVLTNRKAVVAIGSINDCVTIEVLSGVNDENLTISFGNAGGDGKCLSMQNAIDAQQYPMQLRGTSVAR